MRILHFADLHLGVESYGRSDPATGLSTRLADFLRSFDDIVDYALNNGVDLVLFCGDAYKSREPTPTQQREFARRINRLASSGVAVFLLVGNHDLPNAVGKATATEIFDTLAIKNVCVSARPDVCRLETKSGPIQVASLPWPRRSLLLSKEETKDLSLDQVKQKMEEALTRIVLNHASRLDPGIPAVLAAHVWVAGCKTASEKMVTIGQDHALLPGNLANRAFDYVALGHVHKQQVILQSPPVVYAGSTERLDFGEAEDEKGFYVIDIEPSADNRGRQVRYAFHPLNARRFVTIEAKVSEDDLDPTATVLAAISRQEERVGDAIVRLHVILPASASASLRDSQIRDALASAYHCTIARETKEEVRVRMSNVAAGELGPLEALRAWLEIRKVSTEHAKTLLEFAEKLTSESDSLQTPLL
jgi:DNA repair protein SbcD/Mre11